MDNTVSLCMIVKNEEKYLPVCLESVKDIVDEIIVVDTGSADRTVEIAKSFGAKLYFYKWTNDFSAARNESLKYATKDWILIMDGDDEFCSEDKAKFKDLVNSGLDEDAVYSFETLSYCGSTVDDNNISINLNPRLFKNNHGFHYEGKVHNQLINSKYKIKDINNPLRIYHYGYLESIMNFKEKRARNIPILEEQLKEDPENKFAHFNLANEYYSDDNLTKALEHYYKAYENFNPYSGYGFILLTRIVVTNYSIGEYDKALEFADIGIKYFPNYTDLYFLKSIIYGICNKPTLEIRCLEKCIELGEPPSELKFLYGTGSYKAYYALANAYMKLKDYDTAYDYYIKTIQSKRDFIAPVYDIGHLLKERNTSMEEFKSLLESFFTEYPKAYMILSDICYIEGYYSTALEYVKKCEESGIYSESLMTLKARALIRTGSFSECIEMDSIQESSPFYFNFLMYKVISFLLSDKQNYALALFKSVKNNPLSDYDRKILQVYAQLLKILTNEPIKVLTEDVNEKDYTPIIFEICEIFLINRKFDEFEKSLNLFNCISDKSVLLQLGKLYYKYGYFDMAKKELLRSIKEFEIFDTEGLDILR